ncbi:hypothetical protein JAAARDRAFT_43346 [Jaapia argillacea MUCL 33604]|uniref:Chromatin modification-related protein n=1 Tax=Jaapia argillacea MUCL 33604 TaxID=933084 RepID=A0A067QDC6_9AGAM|nr:hypothetical protein JAAARDRAFT_43346 [Jaapia argillacea MUCL 33604]
MSGVPNMEEAAAIAAEYISTLDNLPNEVQFILSEIRYKDTRTQELQREIQKETSRYVRQSLPGNPSPSAPSPSPSPATPNPNGTSGPSTTAYQAKMTASYAQIEQLANEKVALAKRMAELIHRAKAKLDFDLARVLIAQGEVDPSSTGVGAVGSGIGWAAGYGVGVGGFGQAPVPQAPNVIALSSALGRNPVREVNERLAGSIALPEIPNIGAGAVPQKKRKLGAQTSVTSIKLPSPSPAPSFAVQPARPSKLSQQIYIPSSRGRRAAATTIKLEQEEEEDAEGEDDLEGEGEIEGVEGEEGEEAEGEDKELYCFCQKLSYGEMIGCDNTGCRYQWFHLSCVNLKPPLPETWYCDECIKNGDAKPGYTANSASTGGSGGSAASARKRSRK